MTSILGPEASQDPKKVELEYEVETIMEKRFRKGISCKADHLTEHENISKLQSWRQYLTGPPKISPESHELHMT